MVQSLKLSPAVVGATGVTVTGTVTNTITGALDGKSMTPVVVSMPITFQLPLPAQGSHTFTAAGQTDTFVVTTVTRPVTPPVTPPTTVQVVAVGSNQTTTTTDGHSLGITPGGLATWDGKNIPGGDGSSAVAYDPATNTRYGQDATSQKWWSWGGNMAAANWTMTTWTPPGVTPPVTPPVTSPVAPGSSSAARTKLLAYLQKISGNHCLIGQTSISSELEFNADAAALGLSPAIMFNDPWVVQFAGSAAFDPSFMPAALAHAAAGGIVGMSLMLPNPIDGGPSTSGGVDLGQIILPGALNNALNRMLDQAAGLLQQHKDASNAVLLRFMFELDGPWFWWGSNATPAQQTALFRYIVNYFRVTKSLDNLLITFAVNGGPGTYEYPGDDVVDIVGMDAYTDNLADVYAGVYQTLRRLAPSKVLGLTEFGSGGPGSPDRNYDLTRLKADILAAMPMACFANFWSGWGPNLNANSAVAMNDPFWINKATVAQ